MAKTAGSVRASKWYGDPYTVNGERRNYEDLPASNKRLIIKLQSEVAKEMYRNLKDKEVIKEAGDKIINVQFTKKGTEHLARDGMIVLSGKYMSRDSMVNIDKIFAKAEYMRTSVDTKGRTDNKSLFFKYKDTTGRDIFFKAVYEPEQGTGKKYYLYSVTDK